MALVSFIVTTSDRMSILPYQEGSIYTVEDSADIYIDFSGKRTLYTDKLKSYPVGSLYFRDGGDDTSPASLFGGIWSRIAEGELLAGDSGSGGTFSFTTDVVAIGGKKRTAKYVNVWKRIA